MRPAAILLLLFLGSCAGPEPVVPSTPGAGAVIESQSPPLSLSPPTSATEVAPDVFILTLSGPLEGGVRIEEMPEILFIETIYDEKGNEAATSVPSSPWTLLSPEAKVRLAGMKEGERRRIWTCSGPSRARCRVEDVMVGDRAKAVGAPAPNMAAVPVGNRCHDTGRCYSFRVRLPPVSAKTFGDLPTGRESG